jgi:lysine-N-methylase
VTDDAPGAQPLPNRPRLAEYAAARRHVVDGREIVTVHDLRGGDHVELTARAWSLVEHADGTRDLGGVELAAARAGVLRRSSELREALERLHAAGLLAAGVDHGPPHVAPPKGRRLEPLAGATFACDGGGPCCGVYGSIEMTHDEARRALALVVEAPAVARKMTPSMGSFALEAVAAPMIDGRCAFHTDDGRCAIHAAADEAAKPRACSIYPRTFVDDGESVRVSLALECACAFASGVDAPPMLDPRMTTTDDLGRWARVAPLPAEIPLAPGKIGGQSQLAAWSRAVVAADAPVDVASAFWALAGAVAAHGLDVARSVEAIRTSSPPTEIELVPWLEAVAARARGRVRSAAWRSERDVSRAASGWMRDAAERLLEPMGRRLALDDQAFAADERRFLAHTVHGHRLVEGVTIERALRDRAVRVLLGRAMAPVLDAARDEPAWPGEATLRHPLGLVEAMMRGHALRAYASAVPDR